VEKKKKNKKVKKISSEVIIIIIIHEYYYGGTVALLLQDHLTMSVTEQSEYPHIPPKVTISVRNCSAGTQDMSGSQSTGKHSLNSIVFSS